MGGDYKKIGLICDVIWEEAEAVSADRVYPRSYVAQLHLPDGSRTMQLETRLDENWSVC